jgi:hypothetical protein
MSTGIFKEDLENGKKTERELAELLSKSEKVKNIEFNNDSRYDLLITLKDDTVVKLEVKDDVLFSKTGNVAIEFTSWNRESGITVTEADYWAIKLDDLFRLIRVSNLKKAIEDNLYFRIGEGGDKGSNTKLYLFKYSVLKKYFMTL